MYLGFNEEGDTCPECKKGKLIWPPTKNCSCHISPPCSSCTNMMLICDECGHTDTSPDFIDVPVATGLSIREFAPKPLDNTKIDYRSKMHSSCSMIREGVYPVGTTRQQVFEVVKGTFGGRFKYFANGKFKFIVYTD